MKPKMRLPLKKRKPIDDKYYWHIFLNQILLPVIDISKDTVIGDRPCIWENKIQMIWVPGTNWALDKTNALIYRLLLGWGQNFERLWLIRVEAVEAIMHHKVILGGYDKWIWLVA